MIFDVVSDVIAVAVTVFIIAAIWGAALLCRAIWKHGRVTKWLGGGPQFR